MTRRKRSKGLLSADLFAAPRGKRGKRAGGMFAGLANALGGSSRRRKSSGKSPMDRLGGSVRRKGNAAGDVFLQAGGMERYFKTPKGGKGRSWWDRLGERFSPVREARPDDDAYTTAYARQERDRLISEEISSQETLNQWQRETELIENDANIIRRIVNVVRRRLGR